MHLHRYVFAVPLFGFAVGQCGAYGVLWGSWRFISLFLPSKYYPMGEQFLFERYQQLIIFLIETIAGSQLILYGDHEQILKRQENVIWLSNHQSAADWVVCEMLALKQGSLRGVRYILKDTIKYVPLFGWYFPQHNCVFVRRTGNLQDIQDIETQLQIYPRLKMPLWLVIFPEGTRFNPKKQQVIKKSQDFATHLGLPVLKYHLTPRVKAAFLSVNELRGYADAVYDVTVGYEEANVPPNAATKGTDISFTNFALGLFPRVHVKVERIELDDIPNVEAEFQVWLHNRFLQKDKYLEQFYGTDVAQTRRFPGNSLLCPKSTFTTFKSICFWTISTALLVSNQTGFWIWKCSWAAVVVLGSLYGICKK